MKELSFNSEKDWLEIRKGRIGGSSIGQYLDITNIKLHMNYGKN